MMTGKSEKFRKGERLCSRKAIEELFRKGHSFYFFPFQFIWIRTENDIPFPSQVAVSVSKRSFKKAVDRNLIKRRIREVWRRNKHILYGFLEERSIKVVFIIIYKDSSILPYNDLEKSLPLAVSKLTSEISSKIQIC